MSARWLSACLLGAQLLLLARAAGSSEPDLHPIALSTLRSGELVVLDSRSGLYGLDPGSGRVRKLVSGFGAYAAADLATNPADGSILVSMSTHQTGGRLAAVVRFSAAGKRDGLWIWPASEAVMPAGLAIDSEGKVLYVANARRPEIYRIDLRQPNSKPAWVASVRGAKTLGPLTLDAKRSRLLVADPVLGTVHSIDLAGKVSQIAFRRLGEPYALVIDAGTDRLYIADASGERILSVSLADKAATPKVHAKLEVFSDPHALTLGADGTVWIGDEKAEAVFLLSREGKLLRTISLD